MNLFWDPTPAPDPERTQPDEDRMLSGLGSGGSTGARPLLLLQLPGGAKIRLHSLEERARARARAARVLQRTIQPGGQHEPPLQQVTATQRQCRTAHALHTARGVWPRRDAAASARGFDCCMLSRRAKKGACTLFSRSPSLRLRPMRRSCARRPCRCHPSPPVRLPPSHAVVAHPKTCKAPRDASFESAGVRGPGGEILLLLLNSSFCY